MGGGLNTSFTVTYDNESKTYEYSGQPMTIRIPQNKQYTIRFNSVDNYTTPKSQTYTATAGGFNPQTYTYSTCKVTINITGYAATVTLTHPDTLRIYSDLVNGDVVYIPTSSLPLKVSASSPEGYSCTVTGDDISGNNLTVAINYVQVTLGVFVLTRNYEAYSIDNWNTANNANAAGIYLSAYGDDESGNKGAGAVREVILSKDQLPGTDWCTEAANGTINEDVYCTTNETEAILDYSGHISSQYMMFSDYPCMDAVMEYTYNDVNPVQGPGATQSWRLPSAGEMHLVTDNIQEVNAALAKIGGTEFGIDSLAGNMTTTQYDGTRYWGMFGSYGTGGDHQKGPVLYKVGNGHLDRIKIRPFLFFSGSGGPVIKG